MRLVLLGVSPAIYLAERHAARQPRPLPPRPGERPRGDDHEALRSIPSNPTPPSRSIRTLYSYRDVRDVFASASERYGVPALEYLDETERLTHVDHMLEGYPNVLKQRYETMVADPAGAVREVARFLSVGLDGGAIAGIVEDLDRIKEEAAKEPRRGSWLQRIPLIGEWLAHDGRTLMGPRHVSGRGGAPGGWRDALTAEETERIEERFAAWLEWRGYDLS